MDSWGPAQTKKQLIYRKMYSEDKRVVGGEGGEDGGGGEGRGGTD